MTTCTVEVVFPPHLRRFMNLPQRCTSQGATVGEVLDFLERQHPGVNGYLRHENGQLRQHVNLFLDQQLLAGSDVLDKKLDGAMELVIMQALSGG